MVITKKKLLLLAVIAQFLIAACEQEKNTKPDSQKSTTPRYETISEAPSTNPGVVASDNDPIDKRKSSTPKSETDAPEKPLDSVDGSSGISGQLYDQPPFGGPPGPPGPPIAADDEFADVEDDFLARHTPYGICGNSRRELNEHCDDGNEDNEDGCNILCRFPFCGNGVKERGEECDDNNNNNDDGCDDCCHFERCGNGRLNPTEQCDDGNKDPGDGCSPCCLFERCGNDIVDQGEECDDGNNSNGDGCSDCCKREA